MNVVRLLIPGWRWWLVALAIGLAVAVAMPVFGQTINNGKRWNLATSSVSNISFDGAGIMWAKPYENRIISLNGATDIVTTWTHGNTSILGPNHYGSAELTGTLVWSSAESLDHVNRLDTSNGQLISWPFPASTTCGRFNLAVDGSGNAWFGKNDQKVAMLDPVANTITEWPMPTAGFYCPQVFAVEGSGASQKVWFCESVIDKIGFLAPATGSVTEWTISGTNFNDCRSRDASGRIWFTRSSTELLRLDPATNELTVYPCPLGCTTLQGVSHEAATKVWFAEGSQINSFAPATGQFVDYAGTSCGPQNIFVDPVGNVWTTNDSVTVCRFPPP